MLTQPSQFGSKEIFLVSVPSPVPGSSGRQRSRGNPVTTTSYGVLADWRRWPCFGHHFFCLRTVGIFTVFLLPHIRSFLFFREVLVPRVKFLEAEGKGKRVQFTLIDKVMQRATDIFS